MAGASRGVAGHPLLGLATREGVALLYSYMRDWWYQRETLRVFGVQGIDPFDEAIDAAAAVPVAAPVPADRATRSAQIAALVAAAGGG